MLKSLRAPMIPRGALPTALPKLVHPGAIAGVFAARLVQRDPAVPPDHDADHQVLSALTLPHMLLDAWFIRRENDMRAGEAPPRGLDLHMVRYGPKIAGLTSRDLRSITGVLEIRYSDLAVVRAAVNFQRSFAWDQSRDVRALHDVFATSLLGRQPYPVRDQQWG